MHEAFDGRVGVVTDGVGKLIARAALGHYRSLHANNSRRTNATAPGSNNTPQCQTGAANTFTAIADEFVATKERLVAKFTRGAGGGIDGFLLTAQFGWVRDVRFALPARL